MSNRGDKGWVPADRKRMALFLTLALLLVAGTVLGLYAAGRQAELSTSGEEPVRGDLSGRFKELRTVVYNDQEYQYRSGLTTVLLIGIDRATEASHPTSRYRNGGQSDFILLLVIDHQKKITTPIQIDRDSMAEITILSVLGNPAGTRNLQICLSHSFGDGYEQSCLFTADAVSKHLYGVEIDFFVSMNMAGISVLNEALGGVTVTLEDDFTKLDPTMKAGETLTLHGKQAEYYVRNRLGIGVGTNESRMVRQKAYMSKAGDIINEKIQENVNFIGTLFDALKKDLTTNMSRGRMINEAYASRDYYRADTISPLGEHTIGDDGFVEFHADEAALEKLVIELFFESAAAS